MSFRFKHWCQCYQLEELEYQACARCKGICCKDCKSEHEKECNGELKNFIKEVTKKDKDELTRMAETFKEQTNNLMKMIQINVNANWTKVLEESLKIFEENKILEEYPDKIAIKNKKNKRYLTCIKLNEAYTTFSKLFELINNANKIIISLTRDPIKTNGRNNNLFNSHSLKEEKKMAPRNLRTKDESTVAKGEENSEDEKSLEDKKSLEDEKKAFCTLKKKEAACRQAIEELNKKISELQKTSETLGRENNNLEKKIKKEEERANALREKNERIIKYFNDVKWGIKCIENDGYELNEILVKSKKILKGKIREFKLECDKINSHVELLKSQYEEQKELPSGLIWLTPKKEVSKSEKHVKNYEDANKCHGVMIPIEECSAKFFANPMYNSEYF